MNISARTTGSVVKVDIVSGGGGYTAGATVGGAVVNTAGGVIDSVVVTGAVTSVSIGASSGSGASLSARTYTGPWRPMSFFQGRYGEVYGVDGMGRGLRIDGSQAVLIGVAKPVARPSVSASSSSGGKFLARVHMIRNGAGYTSTPTVLIGGASTAARAIMRDGAVERIAIQQNSLTFTTAPDVSVDGGLPTGQTFGVSVSGGVVDVAVINGGTGYSASSRPTVVFSSAQGLTRANADVFVDAYGSIAGVQVVASGTGATTTGVTAYITSPSGSGAQLDVRMAYSVSGVTVLGGGTGHLTPPILTFTAASTSPLADPAAATCAVSGGVITAVTLLAGGLYSAPPTLDVADSSARAVAVIATPFTGRYLCALRYIDSTPPSAGGPVPSSISELTEIVVPPNTSTLTWTISHPQKDGRVSKVELWRTTSDQSVVLYRVATLDLNTATYVDAFADKDLLNVNRSDYALMPITLPSGQVNARRFEVPPSNYGVGVMFQDRAWYAVDTTGDRPNSLVYSEVDEPESVPYFNELIVQENAGEHDRIVALVPFGAQLLVVQSGHIYALTYVAQPVIDAAVALVAYRGILNDRCWAVMNGVAFLVDSYGMYAFDGQSETPLSDPVDNYWRDNIIDFAKASQFHVSSDFNARVIRFHYCKSADSQPTRALCYCVSTKAWWEEEYHAGVTAAATAMIGGKRTPIYGTASGGFLRPKIGPDANASPVSWSVRGGNLRLGGDGDRSIGILHTPTASDNSMDVRLHYNGSTAARPNAIAVDTGGAFTHAQGSTSAQLNMKATRSPLGDATGYAQARFSGRVDPRSVGTDRHVAVAMAGTQGSEAVHIHAVTVYGAE